MSRIDTRDEGTQASTTTSNIRALSAYRYFSGRLLGSPDLRSPRALQLVYFLTGGTGAAFRFGGRQENIVGDYLFLLPAGMEFGLSGRDGVPIDCVHIQLDRLPPRFALPLPVKLRVHSPALSQALLDAVVEYASAGQIRAPLGEVLASLAESRAAVRVTFADHAEGVPPRDTPPHAHAEEHQIDFYLHARGRFWLADRWVEIADGDLFYVPPGVQHGIELAAEGAYHNLSLKFIPAAGERLFDSARKVPIAAEAEDLRGALQQVVASYLLFTPVTAGDLDRILALVRSASERGPASSPAPKAELARGIADANYSLPIGLAWVARRLQVSPAYLSRAFRERTGETFSQHLRRVRVARAVELLRGSRLAVSEIARKCGFATIHHFSHTFRRETGMAPIEMRRRLADEAAARGRDEGPAS